MLIFGELEDEGILALMLNYSEAGYNNGVVC
jgi:hypothetical protein